MRIAVTCQTRSHGSFQQSTMVRHSQDLCNALKMQNNPLNYSEIRVCFSNSYPSPFNNQFNRKRSSQSRRSITTLPNHADLKLSPSKPRKTRYRCPILLTLFWCVLLASFPQLAKRWPDFFGGHDEDSKKAIRCAVVYYHQTHAAFRSRLRAMPKKKKIVKVSKAFFLLLLLSRL